MTQLAGVPRGADTNASGLTPTFMIRVTRLSAPLGERRGRSTTL